jgi:HK97 family phage portal protein
MGILARLGLDFWSKKNGPLKIDEIMERIDRGYIGNPMSGELVNLNTALRVSACLACVKVIADGCATPQLHVYREKADGGRELATNIPEYRLLNRRPNEWQTSFEFRRTMTMHAVLCGDAVAIKVRSPGSKRVRELIPVEPGNVQIDEFSRNEVQYRCYDKFGLVGVFGPDDVLHLPNLRWEKVHSLDGLSLAREAVGLSIAAERQQGTLFANGGRPAGVLSSSQKVAPETIDRLRESWRTFLQTNRNGTAILDNDFKFEKIAFSGVDQQHLEQRRLQVEEVARAFGVFPIMIGHSDKTATFASSEAFFSAHERHTLAPWHESWRQRLDEFVLDGAGPLFAEFDTRYLTQGSMKDRAEWARTMIEMQIMTRNEVRDYFALDAVSGGDRFWSPANITGKKPASEKPAGEEGDPSNDAQA